MINCIPMEFVDEICCDWVFEVFDYQLFVSMDLVVVVINIVINVVRLDILFHGTFLIVDMLKITIFYVIVCKSPYGMYYTIPSSTIGTYIRY